MYTLRTDLANSKLTCEWRKSTQDAAEVIHAKGWSRLWHEGSKGRDKIKDLRNLQCSSQEPAESVLEGDTDFSCRDSGCTPCV